MWAGKKKYENEQDRGIDLVAETNSGEYWAIHAKFYRSTRVSQKDLDSFIAASNEAFEVDKVEKQFSTRLLFTTTSDFGKNAEERLKKQRPIVQRIGKVDMAKEPIDWSRWKEQELAKGEAVTRPAPEKRKYQHDAIDDVLNGLEQADRGKLIMACGTGKTYTALEIACKQAGVGKQVLFVVPSLSLMQQSLQEWCKYSSVGLDAFAVCSDKTIGKKKGEDEDISIRDLAAPATTDAETLATKLKSRQAEPTMKVVFCTYQSLHVIVEAQKNHGVDSFALAIADEAHRTTGISKAEGKGTSFTLFHDKTLKTEKRLYMTATPRMYKPNVKAKALEEKRALFSMDDVGTYGDELHTLSFANAVKQGLLADYRVLTMTFKDKDKKALEEIEEELGELEEVAATTGGGAPQKIKKDIIAKVHGAWACFAKKINDKERLLEKEDWQPMKRAVIFANSIRKSKQIHRRFDDMTRAFQRHKVGNVNTAFECEVHHVDGTMNAMKRAEELDWLRSEDEYLAEGEIPICRVLSNARCLSEGVDVPALDGVVFMEPRESLVDIIQAVGRVMRKAPGKKYGYIILPIFVEGDNTADKAVRGNKAYETVWKVLCALRAHDDRVRIWANNPDFNPAVSSGTNTKDGEDEKDSTGGSTAGPHGGDTGTGSTGGGPTTRPTADNEVERPPVIFDSETEQRHFYAEMVRKVGERGYWENWAKDVGGLTVKVVAELKKALRQKSSSQNKAVQKAFKKFVVGLRKVTNPDVSEEQAWVMLGQHLVTKPLFQALFEKYEFADQNPVSQTMEAVISDIKTPEISGILEELKPLYASVEDAVRGVNSSEGRQKIVRDLYEHFFKEAFKDDANRLGIVYTPNEVVDFILHATDALLRREFKTGLTSKGVHVLDPFTGTGIFISRLLQSRLIKPKDLERKFKSELFANDLVLLAYYVAAISIEEAFHSRIKGNTYTPFEGIVLTDTFQLSESKEALFKGAFGNNSERAERQKITPIRVVVGNPPYSARQRTANDNNRNVSYTTLDARIKNTYVRDTHTQNKNSLYDSYIRAIRWASDTLADQGVVGFVTNSGFLTSAVGGGIRKHLLKDFSAVYCLNLRGNQRSKQWRAEGGKIFGSGSMAGIAILLLVKKADQGDDAHGKLYYHDIGEYLAREEKLAKLQSFIKQGLFADSSKYAVDETLEDKSLAYGKDSAEKLIWNEIVPDKYNDWINQRDMRFDKLYSLADANKKTATSDTRVFELHSLGVNTGRDTWAHNFSEVALKANMKRMIAFYEQQREEFFASKKHLGKKRKEITRLVENFVSMDKGKISWDENLLNNFARNKAGKFDGSKVYRSLYRPFVATNVYWDRMFNSRVYKTPLVFPTTDTRNPAIVVTGKAAGNFSTLMVRTCPLYNMLSISQCFPLYTYEVPETTDEDKQQAEILEGEENASDEPIRSDNISGEALHRFREQYGSTTSREDIFYYVYAILHCKDYRDVFKHNLARDLPRVPFVKEPEVFTSLVEAGRKLGQLHMHYEEVDEYGLDEKWASSERDYRAGSAMKHPLKEIVDIETGQIASITDETQIIYNKHLILQGIPEAAWQYEVNGKPALTWIMDYYQVKKDKDSGIVNDPNEWDDSKGKYIVSLIKRVTTVSVETVKIVNSLPSLELDKLEG